MAFVTYLPWVRLGTRWLRLTARCIEVRKGAGETIGFWGVLDCASSAIDDVLSESGASTPDLKKDKDDITINKP